MTPERMARQVAGTARFRKSKRDYIHNVKDAPCMDCGGRFPPECMDFDHRPDEVKLFTICDRGISAFGWPKLMAEMAKCDLVCSNCHRIRTASRRPRTWDVAS
jgi:hypothetical protein